MTTSYKITPGTLHYYSSGSYNFVKMFIGTIDTTGKWLTFSYRNYNDEEFVGLEAHQVSYGKLYIHSPVQLHEMQLVLQ